MNKTIIKNKYIAPKIIELDMKSTPSWQVPAAQNTTLTEAKSILTFPKVIKTPGVAPRHR